MEPNARNMFDVVLKWLDDMEARSSEHWERWEKRHDDDTVARTTCDAAVDRRLVCLEEFVTAYPERATEVDRRSASQHRRVEAVDLRVAQLEGVHQRPVHRRRGRRQLGGPLRRTCL